MRRLTLALLTATYLCLALIVALGLWRSGAGWGVALSCASGALGFCLAGHGIVARILEMRELRAEVEAVREAHQIMLDQMTRLDGRMVEVGRVVEADHGRAAELTDEIHLLEQLVTDMSRRIDEAPLHAAGPEPRRASGLAETVRDALATNRVDLYLQPVLSLPQRKTVYYESFSRLRDPTGQVIMPGEYLAVAEPAGLVTAIDNLLLFRCVQIVRRLARQDRRVGIFCNISMASLGDDAFFPQFLEMLRANRDLSPALVFEVGQAAFDTRTAAQARNMGKLADLGFRFSLDKVLNLDLDLQELQRADVRFLKIAARTLLDELVEVGERLVLRSMPDLAAEDFALLARRYGIDVVAEKVETERQVVDILDLDIRLGQGHLFGEPRAIREAVLAETGAPPVNVERLRAQAA